MRAPISPAAAGYWKARRNVVGAFEDIDFLLFDKILADQARSGLRGDLLEIGAFLGKSAIVLGVHAADNEEVIICDVFDASGVDPANEVENTISYPELNRAAFGRNYLAWVARPARIVQELSDSIGGHVARNTVRFVHIDGGHHYNVVKADLENTRELMNAHGVVVLDDFRALHTPGVAAAAWGAVLNDGLVPVCVSEQKMYATWSPAAASELQRSLVDWARGFGLSLAAGLHVVAGHEVLAIANPSIMTLRRRVARWVPPALQDVLRPTAPVYVGHPL